MKLVDQFFAILGFTCEHEVLATKGFKLAANDLEHLYELAENKNLVAFVHEFGNAVDQGFHLGAFHVGVSRIDQARMTANLAKAE